MILDSSILCHKKNYLILVYLWDNHISNLINVTHNVKLGLRIGVIVSFALNKKYKVRRFIRSSYVL